MAGFIRLPGAVYQIRKVGMRFATLNLFAVEEMDRSVAWTDIAVVSGGTGLKSDRGAAAGLALQGPSPTVGDAGAAKAFEDIDVMILYTLEAEVAWGGAGDALAFIIVQDMNDVLFNNFLTQRMYLAHSQRVEVDLIGSPDFDLDNLIANPEIQELRDIHAADLVQLAVQPGWSFVGGIASQLMSAGDSGFASRAYSIFSVEFIFDGVALHEMGHNMGAAHHEDDGGPSGAFSYPRGYNGSSDGIRTVMAYRCTIGFCDVVKYFSSPDVTYLGLSVGSSTRDNARTINNTAGLVEGFRDLPTLALVSVNNVGSGSGVVSSSPGEISCGDVCEDYFPFDIDVTLSAVPDSGSDFAGWSGGCAGSDPSFTFTVTGDRFCTASFTTSPGTSWLLTANKSGSGDGDLFSNPAGIDCDPGCSQDSATFDDGTTVTLTAVADGASQFSSWSGSCSGSNPTTTVTMTADETCTAHYDDLPTYNLTVQKAGGGSGRVVSSPTGIDCSSGCNQQTAAFSQGSSVTLTATADAGNIFVRWTGACNGTSTVTAVTMNSNKTCQAEFAVPEMRELTVSVAATIGQGVPTVEIEPPGTFCETQCTENLAVGTVVTLTAHDDGNFEFVRWLGDCSGTSSVISFVLGEDQSCTAKFSCDDTVPICLGLS